MLYSIVSVLFVIISGYLTILDNILIPDEKLVSFIKSLILIS